MKRGMRSIPTLYKGVRFRSRLEARWALFFDEMGLTWQHEPALFAGFPDGSRYLPDFFIPEWNLFVEVKPQTCAYHDDVLRLQKAWDFSVMCALGNVEYEACEVGSAKSIVLFGEPRVPGCSYECSDGTLATSIRLYGHHIMSPTFIPPEHEPYIMHKTWHIKHDGTLDAWPHAATEHSELVDDSGGYMSLAWNPKGKCFLMQRLFFGKSYPQSRHPRLISAYAKCETFFL